MSRATAATYPVQLPTPHVVLSDGRLLRYVQPVVVAEMTGHMFFGPKGLKVLVSLDDMPHGRLLHVSVSYQQGHWPSWRDLRVIKDAFFGTDIDAMMLLPREADYVNVHQGCFHLWQCPEKWGVL